MSGVNPILVEITRGEFVESCHRGSYAIVNSSGHLVAAAGNIRERIFGRSALKPVQALPFLESGACRTWMYDAPEIALAAASHIGEPMHVDTINGWLRNMNLTASHLRCGTHPPFSRHADARLRAGGSEPGPVHNNNSGKHAAFLTTALHFGEPLDSYLDPRHPVQVRVRHALAEMADEELEPDPGTLERCGMPSWRVSLRGLALAMARLADRGGHARAQAAARLRDAIWTHPELLVGRGRLSSVVCEALRGNALIKGGSEGVYAGLAMDRSLGFAVKIDDGTQRAADIAVLALLRGMGVLRDGVSQELGRRSAPVLVNAAGVRTGEMRWRDPDRERLDGAVREQGVHGDAVLGASPRQA